MIGVGGRFDRRLERPVQLGGSTENQSIVIPAASLQPRFKTVNCVAV